MDKSNNGLWSEAVAQNGERARYELEIQGLREQIDVCIDFLAMDLVMDTRKIVF